MTFRVTLASLAVLAALAGPAAADLVSNGDFGTGQFAPAWATTGDGVVIDNAFPYSGTYDAEFTSSDVLSQALTTVPGQGYVLSFYLLDQNLVSPASDTFTVWWGGYPSADALATITGDQAAGSYSYFQFTILGADVASTRTTLSFQGFSDMADWNLDGVSVTPVASDVPEPSTWALLIVAFVALGARFGVRPRRRLSVRV